MRDFERVVGEIAATPLKRDVPLWEIHLCEGFADGKVGIVGKIHHAVADGLAANAMLANIMDVAPPSGPRHSTRVSDDDTALPSRGRLASRRCGDAFAQIAIIPRLLLSTVAGRAAHAPLPQARDGASPCRCRTRRGSRSTGRSRRAAPSRP